jgi:DHA3 family macrolide efflux protein-like MFS transporter
VFVLSPLRKRPVALLWGSQLLTSIGEELFRVASVWLAADLIGGATGYIVATQQLMIFTVSVFGGVLVDRWNSRKAMISVDVIRAAALLVVPAVMLTSGRQVWTLFFAAGMVWGLRGVHGPALQTLVPRIATSDDMMLAMNGLLDATKRLARIAGPGAAGVIAVFVPIEHFFTVIAGIFTLSALSVVGLRMFMPPSPAMPPRRSGWRVFFEEFVEPLRALRGNRLLVWSFIGIVYANAFWNSALIVGLVLLIQDRVPGDLGAYGLVFAAYGLGNLMATLVVGSLGFRAQMYFMFPGRIVLGLGFLGFAVASDLPTFLLIAPIAAFGSTAGDLPFLALMQRHFPVSQIGRVYGVRSALEAAGGGVGALIAAPFIALTSAAWMVGASGVALIVISAIAIWRTRADIAALASRLPPRANGTSVPPNKDEVPR